ncbi:hypothetical protein [Acinetobacter johnsonii]|uniref:O-antigen ligase domain-containing protein n=1 Tax=Acinetobacter johnsonii TaxID=40214 RepID=A0AAW6RUL2_ACIJO|nr:hypothetical protein [Acinetobacter johnsonii]MDG9787052.1 hypothetical protein [Acinetobacter johnsonii]MDG9798494.1 hypothetical protein [Acinetobacter johnsonii]
MKKQPPIFIFSYIAYLSVLLYFIFGGLITQLIYFSSVFSLLYFIKNYKIKKNVITFFLIYILGLIFFSFFSKVYEFHYSIGVIFYFIGSIIMALTFNDLKDKILFSNFIFYTFLVFLLFKFYTLGFFSPDDYNLNIFNGVSRNIVSAFLLFLIIFLSANYNIEKKRQPLIPYFLTFIFCVILYGRSAILISFLLLVFVLFLRYRRNVVSIIFVFSLFLITFSYFWNDISSFFVEKTSFKEGLDSPRSAMIKEYLNGIEYNYHDLLFGRSFDKCCYTIVYYGQNPHNSFINGHARFGIWHTLGILFAISLSFIYSLIYKKLFIFILLMLLLTRYAVDSFGLFSPIDVFSCYLLIYIFKKER